MTKFPYVRSPKLLKACRQLACTNCGRDDGTVCAAHSNSAKHGKGRSIKASDIYVASLCHGCHTELDQGAAMNRADRESMWAACHIKTIQELVSRALWPAGVPYPECIQHAHEVCA